MENAVDQRTPAAPMRLLWIDAAKAVAMLLIFCGHWRTNDGRLETFAYAFHLEFFFFISGFFFYKLQPLSARQYFVRLIKRLYVPFIFFSLFNLVFFTVSLEMSRHDIIHALKVMATGCYSGANYAGQLWFLTAMICIQAFYYGLNRLTTRRWLVVLFCLALYLGEKVHPLKQVFFNLQSAVQFTFFFCLGDVFFRWWRERGAEIVGQRRKLFDGLAVLSIAVAFMVYRFGMQFFTIWKVPAMEPSLASQLYVLVITAFLFGAVIAVARVLSVSALVRDIGLNTLILFCLEDLIKRLYLHAADVVGVGTHVNTAMGVVVFSIAMMLLGRLIFFRVLNEGTPWAVGRG